MIIQSTTLDTEAKVKAIYGGTSWTKIEGRFLLGASSAYKVNSIGGEATHTLTINEMPSHAHNIPSLSGNTDNATPNSYYSTGTGSNGHSVTSSAAQLTSGNRSVFYPEAPHRHSFTTSASTTKSTGGNGAHNNMPPYKAVYIWERTA